MFKRLQTGWITAVILALSGLYLPQATVQAETYTLTTCSPGELVSAINAANATTVADTIRLKPGCTYSFTEAYADGFALPAIPSVDVGGSLTIEGNQAVLTPASVTNPAQLGLFYQQVNSSLTVNNLLASFFHQVSGSAFTGDSNYILTISRSRIFSTSSSGAGGAILCALNATCTINDTSIFFSDAGGDGGALFAAGTVTLLRTSFYFNETRANGGAIMTASTATVSLDSVSFYGNTSDNDGGALYSSESTLTMRNNTLTGNTADCDNNGTGDGGGMVISTSSSALPQVYNTVVAKNVDNGGSEVVKDVKGSVDSASGNNLIGDGSGLSGISDGVNGNRVGTFNTPLDPRLSTPNSRPGGITIAVSPLSNSPLINAGSNVYAVSSRDVYDKLRTFHGTVDIGAAEFKRPDSPVLVNPANQAWLFRYANTSGPVDLSFVYGQGLSDVIPVVGDWNGDGIDTQGIYTRFSAQDIGVFALSNRFNDFDPVNLPAFPFTDASQQWTPVAGDWNGDGISSIGVYNRQTGQWALNDDNASTTPEYSFIFGGGANLLPVAGDWDGDSKDSVGLFHTVYGIWLLSNSVTSPQVDLSFDYNYTGAAPVTGDWNGDGIDTVGFYWKWQGTWFQSAANTGSTPFSTFYFGSSGTTLSSLAGQWRQVTVGNGSLPIRDGSGESSAVQIAPTFAP